MILLIEPGSWLWCLAGFLLMAAELITPGFFVLWPGSAAFLVGLFSLLFPETWLGNWQMQTLLFSLLSIFLTIAGRRWAINHKSSDEPLLNCRPESLIGRRALLSEALTDGDGFISLDGTIWRVSGPCLPKYSPVQVTAVKDNILYVTALNDTNPE